MLEQSLRRTFHVALSTADAKQAFIAMGTGDVDADTLTFDDFMVALCLCATFKYGEVTVPTDDDPEAKMSLEHQCECICFNYAGEKDEIRKPTSSRPRFGTGPKPSTNIMR